MMISIIINQVKNLPKAQLGSKDSNDVFKASSPQPTGKMVLYDDFNHHISGDNLFQRAALLKYFQVYNLHPSFDQSKERFLAMMIEIIINKSRISPRLGSAQIIPTMFSKHPANNQRGRIVFHDDFNNRFSIRQLYETSKTKGALTAVQLPPFEYLLPASQRRQK
ncbi:hypothetical protein Pyn_04996 [Prunus yedoensis var. nudiflora]|uniref:Uncharacterized protein n=1 Tax=Prunus yedoensis var. nudiflora TaxID=2094558 RepID=A0A314UH48_PRUYE|nr:hypothetical protein Pyn_04996 [Prunus yedoensis var. nudiflora]